MAKKSDAVRIAELVARQDAMKQVMNVVCDPLWSSVLGFVVVHEARKANLVGPVADDLLYAGIIAINTARSGVAREAREGATGLLHEALGGLESAAGAVMKVLPAALG